MKERLLKYRSQTSKHNN